MNLKKDNSTFLIKSTKNSSFGTGFCIYKDTKGSYLVTCAHVVASCGRENLLVESNSTKLLHISADEIIDLALIYVEGLIETTTLKISEEISSENDTFDIDGFRPHKSHIYAKEPLKGFIKKVYSLQSKDNRVVLTYNLAIDSNDTIEKGYSGSAIICSQTGRVIAVATDRKRDGKQAYAIPIFYLKDIWKDMPREEIVDSYFNHNPYKGLHSFEYRDKENYYGRKKESQTIAKTIKSTNFFTLLGASGSGKSSLIFAGILPLIEEDDVEIVNMRPLGQPFKNLSLMLIPLLYSDSLEQSEQVERLTNKLITNDIRLDNLLQIALTKSQSKRLYLIIDQFEEIFLPENQKEKNIFLDQLLTLIYSELNITLFISMRADFLSHLSYYEPFNRAFNEHSSTVLSLISQEKLREVIEQPALNQMVKFQDGLIERIIDEVKTEAGQLPLLEFALEQLWIDRDKRVMTHKALEKINGISGAISHYADNIYTTHASQQKFIKKILIKLVNIGDGTENTRRVASFDDFDNEDRKTIKLLADKRLIITKDNHIDIVHEALIREWRRLQQWIEEYRDFLEWEKRVKDDKKVYINNGKKDEDLLIESELFLAKEFLQSHQLYISSSDKNFIKKSISVANKKSRNKKIALVSVFLFLVGIIGVIWYFLVEMEREKDIANMARDKAQKLLYRNNIQQGITYQDYLNNPLKAQYLFAEAINLSTNRDEEKNAKILYNANPINQTKLDFIIEDNSCIVKRAVFSKDEEKILYWCKEKTIKLWDIKNRKVIKTYTKNNSIPQSIYSKRPHTITWYDNGTIELYLGAEQPLILKHYNVYKPPKSITKNLSWYREPTFDGLRGVTLSKNKRYLLSWDKDGTIKFWDVNYDKRPSKVFEHIGILGATFSNNAKKMLTWGEDNKVWLWNISTGEVLKRFQHNDYVTGAIFSTDEKEILSWSRDKSIKLWNIDNIQSLKIFKNKNYIKPPKIFKHNDYIKGAIFSKDGKKILSWSRDKTLRLWSIGSNKSPKKLQKNAIPSEVKTIDNLRKKWVWNRDHTLKIDWSKIDTLQLWSINNSKNPLKTFKHIGVHNAIFSKDSQKILSWSGNSEYYRNTGYSIVKGSVKLWAINREEPLNIFKHLSSIENAKFSNNEQKIITCSRNEIRIWDINAKKPLKIFKNRNIVKGAIFSKDEKQILSWSWDSYLGKKGYVELWSVDYPTPIKVFKDKKHVNGAIFYNNEQQILSWDEFGKTRVYNIYNHIKLNKKYYILKTQIETGTQLTPSGKVEALTREEWSRKRREYKSIF